jgi:DNA polymerase bacteriophage-type
MPRALHLDFETCSAVNLKEVGAYVYARHPSTQVICASFALDDGVVCSTDFRTQLDELAYVDAWIKQGVALHGWNVVFERLIWNHVVAPRMGLDPVFPDQTVCTMATGACYGLPLKLETAARVAGSSHLKNTDGHGVMLRMARPRREAPLVWWHETDAAKLATLIDYNRDDVEAERAISKLLPRMTYNERRVWLADQRMNDRGMPVDTEFLVEAFKMTNAEMTRLSNALAVVTQNKVTSITQVGKLTEWLQAHGYPTGFGIGKEDIETVLGLYADQLSPSALTALSIRQEAAKSSTAKLKAIDHFAPMSERARGLIQYGGAVRTLRWAGRGPQLQNFPRPSIKHIGIAADAIAGAIDIECLRALFGSPLDVISSCLRGAFKAPQGQRFVVCDFSGIEARVLAWLAGHHKALNVFRRNEDIYTATAASIGSTSRQLGKVLVLACGYGMGPGRFMETANAPPYSLGLTAQQAERAVYAYRDANPEIVVYWRASEDAFRKVLVNDNKTFFATVEGMNGHPAPPVRYRWAKHPGLGGAMLIELPSGRHLVYRGARLGSTQFGRDRIVYEGNDFNHNWGLIETYGGKIVENITQAVARDLLADALINLSDTHDDELLATVHDEIIGLTDEQDAQALYDDMRAVMELPPPWAKGLPLAAAGFIGERYGK